MVEVMVRGFPWARVLFVAAVAATASAVASTLFGRGVPWWGLGVIAGTLLVAVGGGVFLQGAGLFARPILAARPERSAGRVALTFDDGPDPLHTRAVLDLLDAHDQRATFFVIGERAARHPELLDEIVGRGHALGNHSFAHSHATPFAPPRRLTDELQRTQQLLARAAGWPPRWFRPPVGLLSPRVAEAAERAGLELVGWTATARDGIATRVEDATARLVRALRPGAILVLHDGTAGRPSIAAAVLPGLFEAMAERGLRSVTLDELLTEMRG
jgi:peptidoglycan/xylan/chitin deacetylase (PgdA/CDA1 family)